MKNWLKPIIGAVGMGLIWAVGWAIVGALLAVICGLLEIPEESVLDPWLALAVPGFVGGVIFSAVLRIAESGRRFDELSIPRLAAWGAVTGLLMGVLPFALVAAGAGSFNVPPLPLAATVIPSVILLSAVSGVGSALLFRYTEQKRPIVDQGSDG